MFSRDPLLKGSLSLKNPVDVLAYRRQYRREHPDELPRSGIIIFSGSQGSGKTLSAVQYVRRIAWDYPKSILVSNVDIKGLPDDYQVVDYNGIDSLVNVNNGEYGVVYLIDEMHLEFNSLESKGMPLEVFTEISQQRKQRKHIVGTSQLFLRLAKPFREQAGTVVVCDNYFGILQHNVAYDGATLVEDSSGFTGHKLGGYWWFHSPELYQSYDTYAKIERRYGYEWTRPEAFGGVVGLPYADLFRRDGSGG